MEVFEIVSQDDAPGSCKEKSCRIRVVSICPESWYRRNVWEEPEKCPRTVRTAKSVRRPYREMGEMR